MGRITVPLTVPEIDALLALAERERREPRQQAALLIRRALEHAGVLLQADKPAEVDAANANG
jgi:hypothetical protein